MNVDDSKILETIERLAREAGAKDQQILYPVVRTAEPIKREPVPEAALKAARYLLAMISSCPDLDDSCPYYTFGSENHLTYGDIRSLKPWLEKMK